MNLVQMNLLNFKHQKNETKTVQMNRLQASEQPSRLHFFLSNIQGCLRTLQFTSEDSDESLSERLYEATILFFQFDHARCPETHGAGYER